VKSSGQNVEIMLWDQINNEFCRYKNGKGGGYVSLGSTAFPSCEASLSLWYNTSLSGQWRSPEEYMDDPLSEKIDVWSIGKLNMLGTILMPVLIISWEPVSGNNIYALLTGLVPYFHIDSKEDIQVCTESICPFGVFTGDCHLNVSFPPTKDAIVAGEVPIIDPRYRESSFAESKLVDIINMCHRYSPDDRPSMAEVQQFLEEAIEENESRQNVGEEREHQSGKASWETIVEIPSYCVVLQWLYVEKSVDPVPDVPSRRIRQQT
jgi:serine/threonine protein kinase